MVCFQTKNPKLGKFWRYCYLVSVGRFECLLDKVLLEKALSDKFQLSEGLFFVSTEKNRKLKNGSLSINPISDELQFSSPT
jgi:hypothetical protein